MSNSKQFAITRINAVDKSICTDWLGADGKPRLSKRTGKPKKKYAPILDKKGRPVLDHFTAHFFDADHKMVQHRILKARTAAEAGAEAKALYEIWKGERRLIDDPLVMDYLAECWKEGSEYVKRRSRRARGKLSADYITTNAQVAKKHLSEPMKGIHMSQVNIKLMESIVAEMEKKGVTPKTINNTMVAFGIPYRDFCRKNAIPNPLITAQLIMPVKPKERGILTIAEMDKLIALEGESPRIKAAVLLMGLCGLRLGEARGLLRGDLEYSKSYGIIHVCNNWIDSEGLKKPKNGLVREVPMVEAVRKAIEVLDTISSGSTFYLFNEKKGSKPIDSRSISIGFARMLTKIGITAEERKRRNLVIHGLRHFFITSSLLNGLSSFEIQKFAGHQSDAMMERYSNHSELIDLKAAMKKMEGKKSSAKKK